jgi:thioredoxin reductase (NADPH)
VTVHRRTELTALEGGERLERVHFRGAGGIEGTITAHHLFVFVGAEPNSSWLKTCGVSLDDRGFVLTGTDLPEAGPAASPLRTSVEGVFAIGDVRSGSTKRVAAAVGEGAAVVYQIHSYLAASHS